MITKQKNRIKIVSVFLSIILLAVAFVGCSTSNTTSGSSAQTSGKNSDYVLKIGYGGSLCEAPLHMAVEKGFFDQEGLKVELVKLAPGTIFDAVSANKIDAGFSLLASMIQPLSNGLPVKITTGLHTGCDKVLVKKDSGINSPKDFKGKKIGVPSMTSSPVIFSKRVLADNGISVDVKNSEVEFVVYSTSDLPIALKNGAVDAIAMNDPTATIAANEYGYKILFDSAKDKPYSEQYCCAAFVSNNIAKDYPDIAVKYTRAMQKASAWVQQNPDEATKIQVEKKWVAGDAAVNAKVIKTYNYNPSVQGAYDIFGITAKQLQNVGMIDKSIDVDALQKNSFIFLQGLPAEFK